MSIDLITSPESAAMLHCSVRTVHRMADAGKLKPVTKLPGPNGAFIFDRAEVEALRDATHRVSAATASRA